MHRKLKDSVDYGGKVGATFGEFRGASMVFLMAISSLRPVIRAAAQ